MLKLCYIGKLLLASISFIFLILFSILLMRVSLLFCLCSLPLLLFAQREAFENGPVEPTFRFQPELRLSAGWALPLGDFAELSPQNSEAGNAQPGWYLEALFAHRLPNSPLWSVQAALGFHTHGMDEQGVRDAFGLGDLSDPQRSGFEVDQGWRLLQLMPGMAFQAGAKFKLELSANAGLLFYSGWNASYQSFDAQESLQTRLTWSHSTQLAMGWRLQAFMGYALNKGTFLGLDMAFLSAGGARTGDLEQYRRRIDNGTEITQFAQVQKQTRIRTLRLGLSIKRLFYEAPSIEIYPVD